MVSIRVFVLVILAVKGFGYAPNVDITPHEAIRWIGDELKVVCKVPYPIDYCRMTVGTNSYRLKPEKKQGDIVYAGLGLPSGECGALIKNIKEEWNGNITCVLPPPTGSIELVGTMRLVVVPDLQCFFNASEYICTFHNPTPGDSYKLYQAYDDNAFISGILLVAHFNLKLVIPLELFDNNTSVNVAMGNIFLFGSKKITFTAKETTKYYNVITLMYSETSDLQFSCQKYYSLDNVQTVQVGFINTTENKIKTFDITEEGSNNVQNKTFKSKDNGTLLCCLYYVAEEIGAELVVTRFIVNKTLLIYQAPEMTENTVNRSTNLTNADNNNNTIIITSVVSASVVALLVVMYVFIKRCQSETNRRERSQRPLPQIPRQHSFSEPHPTIPFYQNMLFRRECEREIQAREEAQYEEIMYQ